MNATKHTPGPWTMYANSPGDDSMPSVMAQQPNGGGLFYVAQCNREEDAAFIATAPDLLAERDRYAAEVARLKADSDGLLALLQLVADRKWWDHSNGEHSWRGESPDGNEILFEDLCAEARALIAKIEGAL